MNDFAAALLAGGHSRRMGTDKAFLPWRGRPLWEQQLEKLRSLAPSRLLLSCRPEQNFPELSDIIRVHDEQENSGPLAGIAACLRACAVPRLLVLGIDLPLLPVEFLHTLANESTADCGAIAQSAEWYEPLAAVYPRALLPLAEEHLAAGRLSLQDFIRSGTVQGLMRCVPLPVEASWFTNWNGPGDLP
jgi:molybdopterin-guanine dinucleotide biosynthesis protein A